MAASATRPGGPSDALLVASARAGQAWATEALFRRYAPMVCGLSLRLLGNGGDADDLAQDCFATAFLRLGRLENPDAFAGWLRGIVVRTAYKRLRTRRLLSRLGLRSADPIETDTLISRTAPPDVTARLREIYAVLQDLPADQRVVLVLRKVEGLKLEEIARATSLSLATVKRRLAEAERTLATHDSEES